jgi:lysophospholipase L1-like esterase
VRETQVRLADAGCQISLRRAVPAHAGLPPAGAFAVVVAVRDDLGRDQPLQCGEHRIGERVDAVDLAGDLEKLQHAADFGSAKGPHATNIYVECRIAAPSDPGNPATPSNSRGKESLVSGLNKHARPHGRDNYERRKASNCPRTIVVALAIMVLAGTAASGGARSNLAVASTAGASGAEQGGLYVALGDSLAAGYGASNVSKSYVPLYYGYLESNGSGVTDLLKLSLAGATSTDLQDTKLGQAVTAINASSDTKAVTINMGFNDILRDPNCPTAIASTCLFVGSLRAILGALNTALAADPGDETFQVMEMYNPHIGTPKASSTRQLLLGSDGKVDCSGTGAALGLNDLIHCISIEQGAKPIEVLPIFDAAGEAFLASDHLHPNDAGHLAIAKAFGGAATPTAPPSPPSSAALRATKPQLSRATAGKTLTASMFVTNADTGKGVKGPVTCQGKLSSKSLRAMSHSSLSSGRSSCTWQMPAAAHNKQFKGSITLRFQGSEVSRSFSTKVK